jgi:hypothetical protein
MKKMELILLLENGQLLSHFIDFALNNYGLEKMNDIQLKINNSSVVKKFLIASDKANILPETDDFLACIHSNRSFMFSKAEIISIASIMLLIKWKDEVGIFQIDIDNRILNSTFISLLNKCDNYKIHLKYGNFFERYYVKLDEFIIESLMNPNNSEERNEVEFDSTLFDAAYKSIKCEFRTIDNLDHINYDPDNWELLGYDLKEGASFRNCQIGKTFFVRFPYLIGSDLIVRDESSPNRMLTDKYVTNCTIQRIRDVTQIQAVREGFGEFKEKIKKLYDEFPSIDAELSLFRDHWSSLHGAGTYTRNHWIWIISFSSRYYEIASASVSLTDEQKEIYLNADI